MCPFFISTHRWKTHSFYLALPLFSLNFPLSLHISRFSPSPLLSEDCLHARRVAEGAGEVIQLRISPSHLSSWYSYHTVAPWGFLPEHWLTEGDFPLSFDHTLVAHFLALISPSSLMSFYLFLAYSLLCCLSSCPSLCLPMFCHLPPPPSSLIVCAFLIVLKLPVVTAAEMAAGEICGEQLIWLRSRGHIHNNILLPLELTGLSGFMSEWVAHKQSCAFVFAETLLT